MPNVQMGFGNRRNADQLSSCCRMPKRRQTVSVKPDHDSAAARRSGPSPQNWRTPARRPMESTRPPPESGCASRTATFQPAEERSASASRPLCPALITTASESVEVIGFTPFGQRHQPPEAFAVARGPTAASSRRPGISAIGPVAATADIWTRRPSGMSCSCNVITHNRMARAWPETRIPATARWLRHAFVVDQRGRPPDRMPYGRARVRANPRQLPLRSGRCEARCTAVRGCRAGEQSSLHRRSSNG